MTEDLKEGGNVVSNQVRQLLAEIQSQCAGHADEFSQRVWNLAENALAVLSAPQAETPQAGLLNIAQRIDTIRGSLEIRRREMSGANHWPHSESVREIEMLLTELAADVRAALPRSEGRAETEAAGGQPSALQKVRAYLVRRAKDVTKPTKYGFQMLRRDREDGSIEYQIFADTKGNGRQIAWVQSSRQDAEFITACLAQAPLFAELLASPSPAPTAHAETPRLDYLGNAEPALRVYVRRNRQILKRFGWDVPEGSIENPAICPMLHHPDLPGVMCDDRSAFEFHIAFLIAEIERLRAALSRHAEPPLLKQEKSDEGCGNRRGERDDSGDSQHVEGRADGSDYDEERLRRGTGGSSERLSGPDCHQQTEAQVAARHAEPQEPSK